MKDKRQKKPPQQNNNLIRGTKSYEEIIKIVKWAEKIYNKKPDLLEYEPTSHIRVL